MSRHRCFSAVGLLLIFWAIVCRPAAAQVTFSQPQFYAVGTRPGSPAIGDFNGDGIPDIAVADGGNTTVTDYGGVDVLLGNGDGTFQPAKRFSAFANPNSIALGDFNGDGKLDIVVLAMSVTVNDSRVAVLLGNGDGTFQPAVATVLNPVPETYKFAVGDFDGDGKTDLVVYNYGPITIWTSKGDGTFQPTATYTFTSFIVVGSIWVSDLNGDGHLDLLLGGYTGNPEGPVGYVGVMLNNGDGTFQNSQDHSLNSFTDVTFVQAHDFSGNIVPDAVAAPYGGYGPPSLQILPNNGDGTLQPARSINLGCQVGVPSVLAVGDFDGDHKPDLAAMCESEGTLSWQLKILLGNGDRTFQREAERLPTSQ